MITRQAVSTLTKERADYDVSVNAPGVVAAVGKALTKGLPEAFALMEHKFREMDSLIIQFGPSAGGKEMIAAWKNARIQKRPPIASCTGARRARRIKYTPRHQVL